MANTKFNTTGILTTTGVTGSFSGFTVVSGSATFEGLIDFGGNLLATGSVAKWILPAGTTVPLLITSASLSTGAVVFYPLSNTIPQV